MTNRGTKTKPSWSDLKSRLAGWDAIALMDLIHDLYAASRDNQLFLHTRFALGNDILQSYKQMIADGIAPDVMKQNARVSVKAANKAISDYKKAGGKPEQLAELMVFFCEEAAAFSAAYGCDDEAYFNALLRTFDQALGVAQSLPEDQWNALLERLGRVRTVSHKLGYGVGDAMDDILGQYGV
ncbi:MAG TPA: hypothetical protein VHA33_04460 [Candidatus Angelobacter sp.]|nr:hypothetical protein [Candidatus Angelobacter sp.]